MDIFSTNIAYAATSQSFETLLGKIDNTIINPVIEFLFALAIIFFLFGVFEFIMNQANEEKKTSGKSHMLWGIIGITIMLGVWTILHIILNTFNIKGKNNGPTIISH